MATLRQNRAIIAEMLGKLEQLPQNLASSTAANDEAVELDIIPNELRDTQKIVIWENTAVWPEADYARYARAWDEAVRELGLTTNKGFALGLSVAKGVTRTHELLDKIDLALVGTSLPTRLPEVVVDELVPPHGPPWGMIAGIAAGVGMLALLTAAFIKAGRKDKLTA